MADAGDISVDVLVVGSGNGALTAALCAYELGVRDVLVIEKTELFGGTSATSGGGIWIPCSRYSRAAGAKDSYEEALEYIRGATPAGAVPPEMQETYLREGPKMLDFLHERTRVRYESLAHYPDYWSSLPGAKHGHRSLEPEPLMRSELKEEATQLRDTHHMMWMFDRIAMTQVDAQVLMAQLPGWKQLAARRIWDHVSDVTWALRHRRSRRIACGCAGVARLRWSMRDRSMPLWLNTAMTELLTDDSGRVTGARISRNGRTQVVRARRAVVLAAGGFEHNQAMREQYLPQPTDARWSAAAGTNTGDAHRAALAIGAATRLMNGGWWCSSIRAPDDPVPRLAIMDKSFPGNIVVTQRGRRIANESQNYITYQLEFYRRHTPEDPQAPSWMIFDARSRRTYFNGPLWPERFRPDKRLPKSYFTSGFLTRADSIGALAQAAGIDPAGLERTVNAMNEYARTGKDLEHGRGDAEYDRYYADPRIKPNPCLAPISEAPFYAMRIDPGDFGTHGGMVTSTDAQVLRADGSPIPGLYAVGNCAAAILPTYPGPGSTLGPAMTFAWQAAKHLSGSKP
ncbi:MAG: FAD-dependent oxidoreductase [Proteobacteria bacterium]|nr:FAD-dependent oxidoreductase [Pseudomonadota bacterium]